jgi:hypothetical protein
MENNILETQKRAQQYAFMDGLMELGGGILCLILAIYFYTLYLVPDSLAGFAVLFLLVFLVAFGIRKLMSRIREKTTYPQSGYIELKKGRQERRILAITIGFSILLLGFMLYTILSGIQTMKWMPVIGGIIYAFIFGLTAYRTLLKRFYFLAGFCLLLGVTLALSGWGDLTGMAILSICTALVLICFGIITRVSYTRQPTSAEV